MEYQDQLGKALNQHGWEITKREDRGEWWEAERWPACSNRNHWGLEIMLSFLVDPQYDGVGKSSAVWAVAANSSDPIDRLDAERAVSMLTIRDIRVPERLNAFMDQIDAYRNQQDTQPRSD